MAAYDLLISNGHLVDPASGREGRFDLAVEKGRIARVEKELGPHTAAKVYDAKDRLVLPGLIDTHVHLTLENRAVGFPMLAGAGVTTALDCAGPVESLIENMARRGSGINVAALNRLIPQGSLSSETAPASEVKAYVDKSLKDGALGVKLLGGHLPLSPETTITAIEAANKAGCYAAFHCGSTQNGSNLYGFLDALEFAGINRLQICHVNAYCRGLTHGTPEEETIIALDALNRHPHLVSESHMAPMNSCWSRLNAAGEPRSHVTRTCLNSGGYSPDKTGLLQAAREGYLRVQRENPSETVYLDPHEGVAWLESVNFETMVSFPVNHRGTAYLCAGTKKKNGDFSVTALSTDGGAIPRNFLLSHGLALVRFGTFSLAEFVLKASWAPARMLGLANKGHLDVGADADLVVVDATSHRPLLTVANGCVIMAGGVVTGSGGTLMTTERGIKCLKANKIPYQAIDLTQSLFYTAPAGLPRLT